MGAAGTFHGAAVTQRTVLGDAWRKAWLDASLPYLLTSGDVEEILMAHADAGGGALLVLVDGALGGGGVIETLHAAASIVLLLAPTTLSPMVRSALRAGVQGFVTLGDPLEALRGAIAPLMAGGHYVSPGGARLLLDELRIRPGDRHDPPDVVLTGRERAVLQAMVDGLTTKSTARHLGISVKTVEAHRSRLFARLHVGSQSEAVTRALTDGRLLGG